MWTTMELVVVACRQLLPALIVFVLLTSTLFQNVSSVLVYDRQVPLNIRPSVEDAKHGGLGPLFLLCWCKYLHFLTTCPAPSPVTDITKNWRSMDMHR